VSGVQTSAGALLNLDNELIKDLLNWRQLWDTPLLHPCCIHLTLLMCWNALWFSPLFCFHAILSMQTKEHITG